MALNVNVSLQRDSLPVNVQPFADFGEEELRLNLLNATWLLWCFCFDLFGAFLLLLLPPSLNAQHVPVGWELIYCGIVIRASERDIFGS